MKGTLRLPLLNFLLFISLFIYLFIYSFIYYSAKFSPNYQTILVSIFLNTSEDACRMP